MNYIQKKQTSNRGFTIVELLIVIVVIGILAAITVVAYGGVQNRANDTAVQSDLRNLASKIMRTAAINGSLPAGGGSSFPGITFSTSKDAYKTGMNNLYYCTATIDGAETFAVAAVSSSDKKYAYYMNEGLKEYTGAFTNSGNICPGLGIPTTSPGYSFSYGYNTSGWFAWTQ